MTREQELAIKQERLNKLRTSPKNWKSPGVTKKLARQVKNLQNRKEV